MFSSALSYLLDPSKDHGLGRRFLGKIVEQVFHDIDKDRLHTAKVE